MTPWWRRVRSPVPAIAFSRLDFLVVDVETTGLNPRRDHVLELGWVPVTRGEVVLDGARGTLVRPPAGAVVGESAVLHGITDDDLAAAPGLVDLVPSCARLYRAGSWSPTTRRSRSASSTASSATGRPTGPRCTSWTR